MESRASQILQWLTVFGVFLCLGVLLHMNDNLRRSPDLTQEARWDTTLVLQDGTREPWHYTAHPKIGMSAEEFWREAPAWYQQAKAEAQRSAENAHAPR